MGTPIGRRRTGGDREDGASAVMARPGRAWLAAALALLMGVSTLVLGGGAGGLAPAQAADFDPAKLTPSKTVIVQGREHGPTDSVPDVSHDDQTFEWAINLVCDQITDQCVNASITDAIPPQFEIDVDSITVSHPHELTVDGQTVRIDFKEPLTRPSGEFGLVGGAQVRIPVKLRPDTPQAENGALATNTVESTGANTPTESAESSVRLNIPFVPGVTASKSFAPQSAIAAPGDDVRVTFGGTNTSNGAVDRLTIQDPADPSLSPSVFQDYLRLDALSSAAWPEGAEQAVVSVTLDGGLTWVAAPAVGAGGALALPEGVGPETVQGVRVEFSASSAAIPPGASASVVLDASQRGSVSGITADTAIPNRSSATVERAGEPPVTGTDDDTLTLHRADTGLGAAKQFEPDQIAVSGDQTTSRVTLHASNSGSLPLTEMTISEPSNAASAHDDPANLLSPGFPGGGGAFTGFENGVSWPDGATGAEITYFYADGTSETRATTNADTLPGQTQAKRATGFQVKFTGSMPQGAEATIPFGVQAPDGIGALREVSGTNEITVGGTTPGANPDPQDVVARDDLTIHAEKIGVTTEKQLSRGELWAVPGQSTTGMLTTKIAPFPDTTTHPNRVVIDDPREAGLTEWYRNFDATAITLTQIPQNATLTVQWRDENGDFHDIPGMVDISGATDGVFSGSIPQGLHDQIQGIRFVYTSDDGFAAGQEFKSNITFTTRATERDDPATEIQPTLPSGTPIPNCAAAEASNDTVSSPRAESSDPCPAVELKPIGPGYGPDIEKDWTPQLVFSHSRQDTTATLRWGTGREGLERVVISDSATAPGGDPSPVQNTSFDTFDLTRIGPISDPLFAYDQVQVQIFNSSTGAWEWTAAQGDAQLSGASIPAIDLTAAERGTTTAVRFIVTEKPGRAPSLDGPQAGGGVASSGLDRRIPLTLELRDTRRSNGDPIVDGPIYNVPGETGVVRNDTVLHGYLPGDSEANPTFHPDASERIVIRDPAIGLNAQKTWDGGPVAIPDWDEGEIAPTTRVTLGVTNTTASAATPRVPGYVREMRIVEPGAETGATASTPFDVFDLVRVQGVTAPVGTTEIEIAFTGAGAPAGFTTNPSLPTPPATQMLAYLQTAGVRSALPNVEGVVLTYRGNLASGTRDGTGRLVLDLELRETHRASGDPVELDTVNQANNRVRNTMLGEVSDIRFNGTDFVDDPREMGREAEVTLQDARIEVEAGKTFTPGELREPDAGPIAMTLSATPGGSERAREIVLTDDRATFWNAYDFVGVNQGLTLPRFTPNTAAGALRVEFAVCTGRDFGAWAANFPQPASPPWNTPDPLLADASCTETGGTWSAWSPALTQADARAWTPESLSPAVAAADVQGIRVRVHRGDDTQWENPKSPTVSIPVDVERRLKVRHAQPGCAALPSTDPCWDVPSELDNGRPPAPGESVKGVATNTVHVDVTGIWGDKQGSEAEAEVWYRHAGNTVEVQKTPDGVRQPGVVFPYTLTVRNTGGRDIVDPTITDRIPVFAPGTLHAGKPKIVFDPDADPAAPGYVYEVTGDGPSTGLPMPTDPALVTADAALDAAAPTITFTFPKGTRLAPGQSYTITIPMMLAPGVTEGEAVTNAFDIAALDNEGANPRKWDGCTVPGGGPGSGDLSADELSCGTDATVTTQRTATIRAIKAVRPIEGNDNDSTATADNGFAAGTDCAARRDAGGFSTQPCVPRTNPGQLQQWKVSVQNTGTTELSRLVVADYLPFLGDRTLKAGFERNSQWHPSLEDWKPRFANDTYNEDFDLVPYVTTASESEMCMTGINNPGTIGDPGDPGDCVSTTDPKRWVAWDDMGAAGIAAADVRAIIWVIDAKPDADPDRERANRVQPGENVDLLFNTRTPADAALGAEQDPRANNSLTVSALSMSGGTTSVLAARDQSNVGIALTTGSLTVEKRISGEAAEYVSNDYEFSGTLRCVVPDGRGGEAATPPRSFTVSADEPALIEHLPVGARCTAEDAGGSQTSFTSTEATVEAESTGRIGTVVLDNHFAMTELTVSKQVHTDATLFPIDYEFEVSCTFMGEPVDLGSQTPFALPHDGERVITGIPVNADCTVTEVGDGGADSTIVEGVSIDGDGDTWGSLELNDALYNDPDREDANGVVEGLAPADGLNELRFHNVFGSIAMLQVEKEIVGSAAWTAQDRVFDIDVQCTHAGGTSRSETFSLDRGNGWKRTIFGIVSGSTCTVVESNFDETGADDLEITPNDGVDLRTGVTDVPAQQGPVEVKLANRYFGGAIDVDKAVLGAGAGEFGGTDFEVELSCTLDGEPFDIPGGATRTVSEAQPNARYEGLPNRAVCRLVETEAGAANESRAQQGDRGWVDARTGIEFTVAAGVNPDDPYDYDDREQEPIALENRFDLASVSVTKRVVDEQARAAGEPVHRGPFAVRLDCEVAGQPLDVPGAERRIAAGEAATWTGLPVSARCSVTETQTGGADRVTLEYPVPGADPVLEVSDSLRLPAFEADGEVSVTLTNAFGYQPPLTRTGGSSQLGLWIGGGAVVVLGALALWLASRRRRK